MAGALYRGDCLHHTSMALAEIGFVPFRVEHMAMADEFELIGCAVAFKEIQPNQAIPQYDLVIQTREGEYESAHVVCRDDKEINR